MKILPSSGYPIRPEDIDTGSKFIGAFGKYEAEETARAIVKFFQMSGDWGPFMKNDIKPLLPKNLQRKVHFITGQYAIGAEYIERDQIDRGVYYINEAFIDRCHSIAPEWKTI